MRKEERLSRAIALLDEDIIAEADRRRSGGKQKIKMLAGIISAAACIAFITFSAIDILCLRNADEMTRVTETEEITEFTVTEKKEIFRDYIVTAPVPEYTETEYKKADIVKLDALSEAAYPHLVLAFDRKKAADRLGDGMYEFYKLSSREIFSENEGENVVFSPVSVYMALSMLAETTGGDSGRELMELLNVPDKETLRTRAASLWLANRLDDKREGVSLIANSLWLNNGFDVSKETTDILAEKYYADSYTGDLASSEAGEALRYWLNEHTGGYLSEFTDKADFPPDAEMELCSTVLFKGKWDYDKGRNSMRTFHGLKGDEEREFMNRPAEYMYCYSGTDYSAVKIGFTNGSSVWFILPDADSTIAGVAGSGEYLNMISAYYEWEKKERYAVSVSLPKFDVTSELELEEAVSALGVREIFTEGKADFSLLTDRKDISVGKIEQTSRVIIDEDGCIGAAYTVIGMVGGEPSPPPESEMEFILDRPFIFVITGDTNQPLFIGTVNDL